MDAHPRSGMAEGVLEGRTKSKGRCPGCGGRLTHKGDCLSPGCQVYRVKEGSRGRGRGWSPKSVVWCSEPRLKPLSREELRSLLEPYLTPDVERLLEQV